MNSSDPEVLRAVLTEMMEESCVFEVFRLEKSGMESKEIFEQLMDSRDSIIQYFIGYLEAIPDSLFLVHEWRVFERSHGTRCTVFKFSMTGNKISDYEDKCKIDEEDLLLHLPEDERALVLSRKRGQDPSVHFKASRAAHRNDKKARVKTLGEFVTDHYVQDHHRADVSQLADDAHHEADIQDQKENHSHSTHLPCLQCAKLQEATQVNFRGVMRFTFNEQARIFKVNCVHYQAF